jgi:hypothetical protein
MIVVSSWAFICHGNEIFNSPGVENLATWIGGWKSC